MTTATRLRSRTEHVMGTAFSITVGAAAEVGADVAADVADEASIDVAVDDAFAWLHRVDATFSTYRHDSEVCRIDRGELDLDDASPDVRQVLLRCAELSELTDGWFTAHHRVEADGRAHLDPSGLVKGWSIDVAALILRMAGATTFSVNGGGDIVCAGAPGADASSTGWRTGIRHPLDAGAVAAVLDLTDRAVATSGTYERGDHIWGEGCGERVGPGPVEQARLLSVTVVGPELGTADALATAVFAEGSGRPPWIATFPAYDLLLITDDLRTSWTDGLDPLLTRTH